jgi:hypothetical protein
MAGATFSTSAASDTIELSAPTTGSTGNMVFWFDPFNTSTLTLNGQLNTSQLVGAIYLASGTLSGYPSDSSGCGLPGPIIAKNITLGGGCDLSLTGATTVQATASEPGNLVA